MINKQSIFALFTLTATIMYTAERSVALTQDLDQSWPALRVHALEAADLASVPDLETRLLRLDDPDPVLGVMLIRLTESGPNTPTAEARNRLWRLLAHPAFLAPSEPISSHVIADQFAAAYTEGDRQTRVLVAQQIGRLNPGLRGPLASAMRAGLASLDDAGEAIAVIAGLGSTGELDGAALAYAETIAQDPTQSHTGLHAQIFHQHGPSSGMLTDTGTGLRISALAAVMRSKPDLDAARVYARSFPDDDPCVADAMRQSLGRSPTFDAAIVSERAAWIGEYTRRFVLDASTAHRRKFSLNTYLQLLNTYDDTSDAVCDAFDQIFALFGEDIPDFEYAAQLRTHLCD